MRYLALSLLGGAFGLGVGSDSSLHHMLILEPVKYSEVHPYVAILVLAALEVPLPVLCVADVPRCRSDCQSLI